MRNRFACMQLANDEGFFATGRKLSFFFGYNDQLPSVSNITIPPRISAHDLNGEQDQSKLMELRRPLRGITYTER